ncbi:MAG TPA: hypothetical protein VM925_22675 [Labilithrix sp.]|nr:hypothetical protein [Labilithrix sp.]
MSGALAFASALRLAALLEHHVPPSIVSVAVFVVFLVVWIAAGLALSFAAALTLGVAFDRLYRDADDAFVARVRAALVRQPSVVVVSDR